MDCTSRNGWKKWSCDCWCSQGMVHVMAQTNEALLVNQQVYQNGGAQEVCGLGKFLKNNPHTFKGRYDPKG